MKRQIIYIGLLLVTVSISLVEKAFAGAWTVPGHKAWGESYMKWDYAKEEFNAEGERKKLSGSRPGMTLWGKNTTAYQEWVLKVQTQF